MNINVYNAMAALLEVDISLTAQDKEKILAVCKHPDDFLKPEDGKLPRLLTIKEASSCLHISRQTLWHMTMDGKIRAIRFYKDGNPRYSLDDIKALIDGITPASEGR